MDNKRIHGFMAKLTKVDMFGTLIGLTFEGGTKFKTSWGAINTILCFTIIFGFTVQGGIKFLNNETVGLEKQMGYESSFDESALNLSELDFKIAFGILNEELDPRIGSFYV